ncbi:hypothetical protein BUALT_Bualt03G0203800 [Buddleja alternifolia]|uniref:F-box domain-containing protein n=1 Tax=Buddleja alternifolia TaxID=168488 RepID=A0AAV6XXJ2_9LAMI|nr:hypothetical protein BUALT_Bualt03G0203800 [Buddleja alternifolia]
MEIKSLKTEQIPTLPEEILSRLPVKSLLKFRCVSRSWHSLIGSKKFIKTHLQNSTKNTNFTHHKIISNFCPPQERLKHCSLHSLLYEPVTYGVPLDFDFDYPTNNREDSFHVVGCCNGLICILVGGKHFYLWNPSTRESKKLPVIDNIIKWCFFVTKYGFGYDERNDDYKVFGLLSVFWHTGRYQSIGKIYSLKTNSWKNIDNFKDRSPFEQAGIFASGKLHWERKFGLNSRWDIVSFDLKNEVYEIVEQPNYVGMCSSPKLEVLEGCLCVLYDYEKIGLEIWVMKNYGVKESWYKLMNVPNIYDLWRGSYSRLSSPLCIGSNGELVFTYGSTFVVYYPKDNRFQHPQIMNFVEFRGADVYVESLVSLVSDERQN